MYDRYKHEAGLCDNHGVILMPTPTLGNLETQLKIKTYLREWRLNKRPRLNISEAAAAIGVHPSTLSKAETGASGPTLQVVVAAARLYGCTPGQILSYPPSKKAPHADYALKTLKP
jgi:transcriptional regulator with XRE-family HTH domain